MGCDLNIMRNARRKYNLDTIDFKWGYCLNGLSLYFVWHRDRHYCHWHLYMSCCLKQFILNTSTVILQPTVKHVASLGFLYQSVLPRSAFITKHSGPRDSSCSSHVSVVISWVEAKQLSDRLHRLRQLGKYDCRGSDVEFINVPLVPGT